MDDTTVFSTSEYETIVEKTLTEVLRLGKLKGGEYSGDIDRLLNFRRAGYNLQIPPELALMIYAGKHWDALVQYASDLNAGVERERLEDIEGRIDDLINYMLLYKCMRRERVRKAKK